MKKFILTTAISAIAAIGFTGAAFAGAGDSPTLQKIAERGYVSIGHRETSVPFSYIGDAEEPIGYSIDLCHNIVDAIKAELGNDNLTVKYVPVTGQTRIPLIANGSIDLECGSTTNNLTRQKALKAAIAANNLDVKVVTLKDHSQGWLALDTDRIDAYGSDDVLLYGLISKSADTSAYQVTGRFLSFDPYAIMVPRNDSTFERLGRIVMSDLMRSGEMENIYNKWFSPGPTKINMPLSNRLRGAFDTQAYPH